MRNPSSLDVLDHCAVAAGLEYDPILMRRVLDRAERAHPGALREVWYDRLSMLGQAAGFRVGRARWSVREAIAAASPEMPFVTFLPGDDSDAEGRWIVLSGRQGRRARVAGLLPGEPDRLVRAAELSRWLGRSSPDEPADWAALQPIAPCEGVRDPNASEGDHAVGHGPHSIHGGMSPLRRLVGLIRPEWRDIRFVVVYAVGVGILSLATPLAIEALVNTVALSMMMQQLVVLAFILLGCLGLAAAFRALQTIVVEIIQRRLFVRVASDLAYRLPRVRIDAYDHNYGPELVNRFFDVLTVQKIGALILLDGIAIVLQAAVGLAVLAFYHPYLLGFDLVILGVLTFIVFQLGRGAVATSIQESRAKYAVAGCLEELARAPVAYKLKGGPDFALDRADALTRHYLAARKSHFAILMRQIVFALGFQAVATSSLLGLGGWLVMQGQLTLGQLVAAELIVATVVGSFAKLGKHMEGWYDLLAAVEKLGLLTDLPLERLDGEELPANSARPARLRLRGVSFHYGPHREVLHHLDLDVRPGERLAIVGPSGSGKSTLTELIYGLRAPTSGHIELDGVNLRDLSLETIRGQVAAVKGLDILEGTILENVRVGRTGLTMADVHEALEAVGLADEVAALPDGMHTRLSTSGAPLSMGQARRLLLARAIVNRPRLLVLDEALDGIDLDTRRFVLESLTSESAPWTLVVVTHDQEVAQRCDRVVALADGHTSHTTRRTNGEFPRIEDWLREVRPCRFG